MKKNHLAILFSGIFISLFFIVFIQWQDVMAVPASLEGAVPASPPTVNIKVNNSEGPITVEQDAPVILSWSSTYADNCTASGEWSGAKPIAGSESSAYLASPGYLTYLNDPKIFTITCYGGGGQASDNVKVHVAPKSVGEGGPKLVVPPPISVDLKVNGSDGPIT